MDTAQTGIEEMLEEAESENLAVDEVIADITNYEAPDLYNIVVMTVCFICYRMTKYAMRFLKNPVMQSAKLVFLFADTPRHKSLICDYFKSVPKIWKIINNEKNFFFNHKIALVKS